MSLIEIKGLKDTIAGVKGSIGEIRSIAAGVNEEATGLRAELSDLQVQLKQHRADLRFEAETLGNSSAASSGSSPETHTRDSSGTVIEK